MTGAKRAIAPGRWPFRQGDDEDPATLIDTGSGVAGWHRSCGESQGTVTVDAVAFDAFGALRMLRATLDQTCHGQAFSHTHIVFDAKRCGVISAGFACQSRAAKSSVKVG